MRVLHITNWYPNKFNLNEAPWIAKQIKSLPISVQSEILHFEIFYNNRINISTQRKIGLTQKVMHLPFRKWYFIEFIYSVWLFYQLIVKRKHRKYDIINFHIAYPMLTYWHWIKKWVEKPIVITEHWSAYNSNFGVSKQLPRIKKIFQQNIPVITISEALAKDIIRFSLASFKYYVVPNVVNEKIFCNKPVQEKKPFLFMVSQWKSPKTPLLALQAFTESEVSNKLKLKIGGFGPMMTEIQSFVTEKNLADEIDVLGSLDSREVADYMQQCTAFLHPSDYETFSVVCAEAVACGAYVIAPNLGGIPEVVGVNGNLLEENTIEQWKKAFLKIPQDFDSEYDGRFNVDSVGEKYLEALKQVEENFAFKR